MSGSESYHDYPQPYRIQKRLVLNQCFKCIQTQRKQPETLNYVTFGGEDLYDVMDLLAVFDIRRYNFNITSYEQNQDAAEKSSISPVAKTLLKVPTVSVEIIPTVFFENSQRLWALRPSGPFIYFLDDTKTFREHQASTLLDLLRIGLLRAGDWLLITSCFSPRIVHQANFMTQYDSTFRLFYGVQTSIDARFRVRNHVDLLIALTFSRHESVAALRENRLRAILLRKFKYQDTRAAMGLWLYHVDTVPRVTPTVADQIFDEFPHAFAKAVEKPEAVPNIFD